MENFIFSAVIVSSQLAVILRKHVMDVSVEKPVHHGVDGLQNNH